LLTELRSVHAQGPAVWSSFVKTIAQDPRDPRLKLLVHWRLLQQRLELPDLYLNGNYEPLAVRGAAADHAVAFQRTHGSTKLIVLVGRLYFTLIDSATESPAAGGQQAPISPAVWGDATVELPGVSGKVVDALTGREQLIERNRALLADLFCSLPIVVLIVK
jgi:maltooligosyltrehalose synthase